MAQRVLVVDGEPRVRGLLEGLLRAEGWQPQTVESLAAAQASLQNEPPDLLFTDLALPDGSGFDLLAAARAMAPSPLGVVLSARASVESAVGALRAGAFDFLTKPILPDELRAVLGKAAAGLGRRNGAPAACAAAGNGNCNGGHNREARRLVGRSPRMQALHELVRTVAGSSSTVLIRGESGTGKELVARALHDLSPRARGPLVPVNCGAIPEDLLESELFGHVRGAFTGAVGDRLGRFVLADGGTIFLDEIGDMSPKLQVKVLRVLQEQELEPVGGTQTVRVGVRVVAATNIDLEMAIELRRFREDLYYRLNVIPIEVPALRERIEDLPLLTRHFLKIFNKRQPRQIENFAPETLDLLTRHHWPGNVRELENLVERMTILARGCVVMPDDLPPKFRYPDGRGPQTSVAFPAPATQGAGFFARFAAPPPPAGAAYVPVPPPGAHRPAGKDAPSAAAHAPAPPAWAPQPAGSFAAAAPPDEGVSVEERVSMGLAHAADDAGPARTASAGSPAAGFAARPPAVSSDAHSGSPGAGAEPACAPTLASVMDTYERTLIAEALRQSGGVKSRAAIVLGIKRTTLVERMKKLRL